MKEETKYSTTGQTITFPLIRHDPIKGIFYFEGGWWMAEVTYRKLERRNNEQKIGVTEGAMVMQTRLNNETKEIELYSFWSGPVNEYGEPVREGEWPSTEEEFGVDNDLLLPKD